MVTPTDTDLRFSARSHIILLNQTSEPAGGDSKENRHRITHLCSRFGIVADRMQALADQIGAGPVLRALELALDHAAEIISPRAWVESKARTLAATALRGEESRRKAAESARREAMLRGQSKQAAAQRIDTERAALELLSQPAEAELRARALAGLNPVIVKAIGDKSWRESDILRGTMHALLLEGKT